MSNILTLKTGNPDLFHVEAAPHGVNIMSRNDDGLYEHVALIGYSDAVNRLDTGEYDDTPDFGLAVHCEVAAAGAYGWFDFTAQQNVIMWRWLIASTFIFEMKEENGVSSVTEADGTTSRVAIYSNGSVGIPVYPFAERLAMANNIEGAMIERYGVEQGTENAVVFYRAMLDAERGELTPFGRETLAKLHDHFIADLDENGFPETPVAH